MTLPRKMRTKPSAKAKRRVDVTVEIGERLARKVFEAGRDQGWEVTRIAFKAGRWTTCGVVELELSGLCESALASVLMAGLREIFGGGGDEEKV